MEDHQNMMVFSAFVSFGSGARRVRRVATNANQRRKMKNAAKRGGELVDSKSGTRDSNSRLQPWQEKV